MTFHQDDQKRLALIKKRDKKLNNQLVSYADKSDFALIAGCLKDLAALGYLAASTISRAIYRTVRHPQDRYRNIKGEGIGNAATNAFENYNVKPTLTRVKKQLLSLKILYKLRYGF